MIDISTLIYPLLNNSILCRESAAHLLRLTTDFPTPVRIYNNSIEIKSQFIEIYKNEYDVKDVSITKNGLRLTNAERTICELVKYDCQEESILRAIDTYLYAHNKTPEVLLVKSTEYGVFDEMKKHIDYVMENDIYDES